MIKKGFVVRMRCVVIKEVVVADCTEEQAASNPWDYAEDENDIEQTDWEVLYIRENA